MPDGLRWRRTVSLVVLLLVWMVFVVALAAIGWYVWSVVVDPPPYRDPEAVGAATASWGRQLDKL